MKRPLFASSYDALPYAAFAFFVLCFALHPQSPFFTHRLADPDDYMRLNQVAAWMQGQGWYDLSVPRLSSGANTIIHWSRLVDIPLALFALPFIPFFGLHNALLVSAFLVPLAELAVLFALLTALAKMFVGDGRAKLICIMALFAPFLTFVFSPGRADHHATQILIAGFGLLSLLHIIFDVRSQLFAILAALAFSCGFWIGAEILPWILLFIACLGVASIADKTAAKNAALFGVCLFGFTTALIPIALPVSEFSSRALSWFSPAYAIFAGLVAAVFVAGWGLGCVINNKFARFSLYALLGGGAAGVFVFFVPDIWRGPFADYNSFDATAALDNIIEAQPLANGVHFNRFVPATLVSLVLAFFRFLFLPLIALLVCLYGSVRTQGKPRGAWLALSVFLFAAIVLSVFWQMRAVRYMQLFALIPLTYLVLAWWNKLRWGLWDRPLFLAEIGVFLLLGPLPIVLLPAIAKHAPLYPDVALFSAARPKPTCPMESVLPFLNDPERLGAKPLTIMNTGDTGPQLLFSTPHRTIAGNFNVEGNRSAFDFFSAKKDAPALTAAKKWNADIVLICRAAPLLYLGKDYYSLNRLDLLPGKDGLLHLTNTDPDQPLIQRLLRGHPPYWLKPIEIFGPSDYLLFRIQYPKDKE